MAILTHQILAFSAPLRKCVSSSQKFLESKRNKSNEPKKT
jgi:hypothetical protein